MDITRKSSYTYVEDGVALEITTSYEERGVTSTYRIETQNDVVYLGTREFTALTHIIHTAVGDSE